ncbi:outer membrane lipid asymmetry maintenance protein MlaD [Pseudoalteromonas sp. MMG013]|uniref:Phospholipid/cholesterol/gamma-HCH transport system substrate-binding protein n=1 Tax=Pseudoalteromonas aurantia 208 TaxID=1314867 RepID=A0ABR9E786_9GAMM|nr:MULTISPECIES: outer membrane lipid asymmetry maintenance protein MlaD [Pseudoalteromonas]MBE0366816.1 phospholipid/cholesterol/gamma-HCH transport system substrate-binding protein [Pseudoalteromonas aurantia 208]MBQ4847068.1 outer membrane lipid asymmetry maintenance protein MlaD [Pseudoalteromonas sp. MMG005]MBQ4849563.1 outer membrane lipid asymmetry maintenance protein MlaD [Pseudoalteromonas sp. MMG012]MBQ4861426.1 outer membrane lipid asymmetry maintenance protein MlaD [Pseudoalteromona
MNTRKIEILVGLFVALGVLAFAVLALKVANSGISGSGETYTLNAKFENIGSLKARAPIKVGGVVIGRVEGISIHPQEFVPVVNMTIDANYECQFSDTTSVSILTSGILGEQYLGISPVIASESARQSCFGYEVAHDDASDELEDLFGVESKALRNGDLITDTKSALVLEELIGQFLFNQGSE